MRMAFTTHYQQQLLMEFEDTWMNLREQVILLKESLGKTKLLYHLDRWLGDDVSADLLSDLLFLKSSVEIISALVLSLDKLDKRVHEELVQSVNKLQQLLTEFSFTLTLKGNLVKSEIE